MANINISGDNSGIANIGNNNSITQNHSGDGDYISVDRIIKNFEPPRKVPKVLTITLSNHTNFVGRKEELQKVDELLNQNSMLLLINGIGGIGKSTLASYYFNQKKDNFDYYGFVQVNEDIKQSFSSAFSSSLNLKSEKIDDLFVEIMNKLQNLEGKKLLIIDDVKEMDNQLDEMNSLMTLKNSGFQILFTSREVNENISNYFLDRMSISDAIDLFLKYYMTDEMNKVDKILKYLDYHTFFIEITAKTLTKRKHTLTIDKLLEKFEKGEFTTIKKNRQENFNHLLNNLFSNEQILQHIELLFILQNLSILPSIKISFEYLNKILLFKNHEKLENYLFELVDNGWLIFEKDSYTLHKIIKEYLLTNYPPKFETIEGVVMYFNQLIDNSADPQTAINVQNDLIYFDSIAETLNIIQFHNEIVANFYERLGNIYRHLGEYSRALHLFQKVVEIREKILGENHIDTATSYNNLALIYNTIGEYAKALPFYTKSLEIKEKLLGDKPNSEIALSYNNLAGLYYSKQEYIIALEFYEKALDIWKKILGENHPSTAISYNNIAELYKKTKEYDKSLENYNKSLKIRKETLPKSHPDIIQSLNSLIDLHEEMNDKDKAQKLIEELIALKYETYSNTPLNISITKKSEIKAVLGVQSIADTLASVVANQSDDSGMMVGIFGKWGRGKSYLAEKTWESLEKQKPKYKRVLFSAWKYQDTKASWAYLYETFTKVYFEKHKHENITTWVSKLKSKKISKLAIQWNKFIDIIDNKNIQIKKTFQINYTKYSSTPIIMFILFLSFGWIFLTNKLELIYFLISSFGFVILINLALFYMKNKTSVIGLYNKYFSQKNYNDYLGFQAEIENELTNLLKTWIPISNENEKIVLFVDDIDRCHIEQIVNIIDGLRVILDNIEIHNRLIIITAIDEKILMEAIRHKYAQLNGDKLDLVLREYLEKVFIIGLKLDSLSDTEVSEFLKTFLPKIKPTEHEKNIENMINSTLSEPKSSNNNDELPSEEKPQNDEDTSINTIEPQTEEKPDKIPESLKNEDISTNTIESQTEEVSKTTENITYFEREYMINTLQNLENNTPRKIRIFYYKYLIMKQLFYIRLKEKGLFNNWKDNEENGKLLIDILIDVTNNNSMEDFSSDIGDEEILIELKYVVNMVSVI